MKGQISRLSHIPAKGYSGLIHRQGGMITDADLNESTAISRARVEWMGRDAIDSGAPAQNGIVWNPDGKVATGSFEPFLRPGIVYAGGVRGEVRARSDFDPTDPLQLLKVQDDLFDTVSAGTDDQEMIYADIWHRTVHPLEDARINEVAFHGAQTAFRQKTMAQLKVAPLAALSSIANGGGAFPTIGTGTLSIEGLSASHTGSICDPCASEIPLEDTVPNALFRVEVMAVTGPANAPRSVALAWSRENAAEMAPIGDLPDGFTDGTHAYEHATWRSETHKGVFADPSVMASSVFESSPNNSGSFDLVRRWDGYCDFALDNSAGATIGSGSGSLRGGQPRIAAETFAVSLDFAGKRVMVGDYWLVEMRTNAPHDDSIDERLFVVSPTPLGHTHHYAPLFRVIEGRPQVLTPAETRALTFPTLGDIPASHVGFANACPDRFDGAETVQDALNVLCGLDAAGVPFNNVCSDLYGDADTVQGALAALCDANIGDTNDRTWMRYVLDWGVLCGLKVKRVDTASFTITPGAYLDWQGNFAVVPWDTTTSVDLGDIRTLPGTFPSDVDLCLGVERLSNDRTGFVVGPVWAFELPGDRTLMQKMRDCESTGQNPFFDGVLGQLDDSQGKFFGTVVGMAMTGAWRSGAQRVTDADYSMGLEIIKELEAANARENPGSAGPVGDRLAFVSDEYDATGMVGIARAEQQGKALAGMVNVLIGTSEEMVNACKCWAIWPDCLNRDATAYVPLALIEADGSDDKIGAINHLCMVGHRKQAMTPRTMAYYLREVIEQVVHGTVLGSDKAMLSLADLADFCCPQQESGSSAPGDLTIPGKDGGRVPWTPGVEVIGVLDPPDTNYYDIIGQSEDAARDIFTGNGVDVDVVDIGAAGALDAVGDIILFGGYDDRFSGREQVAPGGKVTVLMNDGEATGYVVNDAGSGKYTYTPESEKIAFTPPLDVGNDLPGTAGLDTQLGALEDRFSALDAALTDMNSPGGKLSDLQMAFDQIDAGIADRINQADGIGGDLPDRLAAHETNVQTLAGELDASEATLTDIGNRRDALQVSMQAQLDQMVATGLGDQQEAMNAILVQLSDGVGSTGQTHADLQAAIATTDSELAALELRTNETARQLEAARLLVDGADVTEVLTRLDSIDARRSTLDTGLTADADRLTALEAQVTGMRNQLDGVEAEAPGLLAQINGLTTAADSAAATVAQQTATLDSQLSGRLATLSAQETQSGQIDLLVSGASGSLDGLEARRITLDGLISGMDAQLAGFEQQREAQIALLGGLQSQVSSATTDVNQLQSRKVALEGEVAECQTTLAALENSTGELLQTLRRERPVNALEGVGEAATRTLSELGFFSVADIADATPEQVKAVQERASGSFAERFSDDLMPAAAAYIKG